MAWRERIDKTVVASIALHVLVLGWGLISFQSKAFDVVPEESLPVDVISSDALAKVMAGQKTGAKTNPKPLVEKVAEVKPVPDDMTGKVTEKAPVVTETKPPPPPPEPPKVVEKKPDPKPEPPKPVAEKKEEVKPTEKKPEPPKVDPIAEALKKEEKKEPPKQQAKAAPAPKPPAPKQPIQDRHFDQSKIAELLDKRDPSRNAVTGEALNSNAALGLAKGKSADNSATWGSLFRAQVERCWKKPFGGIEARTTQAIFSIRLKRDGTLETTPSAVSNPTTPFFRVYQESAMRAIIECQPYQLPTQFFDEWKFFEPVFTEAQT